MSTPDVPSTGAIAGLLRRALVFDHIRDGVVLVGLDGTILDWNGGAERIFGWTRDEVMGETTMILMPRDAQGVPVNRDATWTGENEFARKDGTTVVCETTAVPLRDMHGRVIARLEVHHDVTRRREAEQALAAERALLRAIIDASPDPIFCRDLKGRNIVHNTADARMFSVTGGDFTGKTIYDQAGPKELLEAYRRDDELVMETGEPLINREEPFRRADGTSGWFLTSKFPLRDTSGRVIGLIGIARDITERRKIERRLAEERQLLRTLIDAVPDPIFCKDAEGRYLLTNRAHQELYRTVPFVGRTAREIPLLAEFADIYEESDRRVVNSGDPLVNHEEPHLRADGSRGIFVTSKFPLRDADGRVVGLVGICRDITDIKRAAEELEKAQRRLVDHVENSPLAIVEWAPDLSIERWTGQAQAIFGWTAEEVVGRRFGDWDFVHPNDAQQVKEVVAELVDGRCSRNTCQNRNITKSGKLVHTLWQNSVLRDEHGAVVSILSLVQDVTERVEAEEAARAAQHDRAELERKLLETQKLESLGVLAGGIAHDFNNLLTGILGNASLASTDLHPDSPIQEYLQQIEMAATRAADLCKQMLAYSGKGRFVVRLIDINEVVRETTNLLQVSISKNSVLHFDLTEGLPPVSADATQMRQILMNLVINASEAITERSGIIRVSTGKMRATREYLSTCHLAPEIPAGDYVWMEVADTGAGMTPEVLGRIFDPFFTTKFTGRGLGLAAVLGIVRGHSGALKVESTLGEGTTFRVLLPCAQGTAETVAQPVAAEQAWRGSGTALIIDDEETVRAITGRMLELLGFRVIAAPDGVAGVEQFVEAQDEISIVLLDLTMPRMGGEETLRELRKIRPDVRVVLMSGFTEQDAVARFPGRKLAGFLQKPFKLAELRERLQQALD